MDWEERFERLVERAVRRASGPEVVEIYGGPAVPGRPRGWAPIGLAALAAMLVIPGPAGGPQSAEALPAPTPVAELMLTLRAPIFKYGPGATQPDRYIIDVVLHDHPGAFDAPRPFPVF